MIELLVGLAIIGVLLGLILPVLAATREAARGMQCQANLRTMQFAWLQGTADLGNTIPWTRHLSNDPNWLDRMEKAVAQGPEIYGTNVESFNTCPSVQRRYAPLFYHTRPWGYVVNTRWKPGQPVEPSTGGLQLHEQPPWLNQGKNWNDIRQPSRFPWFMDPEIYALGSGYQAQHFAPSAAGHLENWGVGANHDGARAANVAFADGSARRVALEVIHEQTAGAGSFAWFENR